MQKNKDQSHLDVKTFLKKAWWWGWGISSSAGFFFCTYKAIDKIIPTIKAVMNKDAAEEILRTTINRLQEPNKSDFIEISNTLINNNTKMQNKTHPILYIAGSVCCFCCTAFSAKNLLLY